MLINLKIVDKRLVDTLATYGYQGRSEFRLTVTEYTEMIECVLAVYSADSIILDEEPFDHVVRWSLIESPKARD